MATRVRSAEKNFKYEKSDIGDHPIKYKIPEYSLASVCRCLNTDTVDIGESGDVSDGRIVRAGRISRKISEVSARIAGYLRALSMPTVDAIRRGDSVARLDEGRVFLFFERLM